MILKGATRSGANDLSVHLLNAVDNEQVNVAEIKGAVANTLYDAFREWELLCGQTLGQKPFYSLSINPDPSQRDLTSEEWRIAIDHIEEKLGLTDQPRAIVFHEKHGEDGRLRKHCHVVFSRIRFDGERFRAVHISCDYYKLKTCARDLTKQFGLDLHYEQAKSKSEHAYDFAKSHGKNRDPITARERKQILTELWRRADTPQSFCFAVSQAGFIVARGDRRSFIVLDVDLQAHALSRHLDGIKAKQVRAFLGDPESYPSVEQAKDEVALRQAEAKKTTKRTDLSREQRRMMKLRRMAQRADQLNVSRQQRLNTLRTEARQRHAGEVSQMISRHSTTTMEFLERRKAKHPTGRLKTFCDGTGLSHIIHWLGAQSDKRCEKKFAEERRALSQRHEFEKERLIRFAASIIKQSRRESRSIARLARQIGHGQDISKLSKDRTDQRMTRCLTLS